MAENVEQAQESSRAFQREIAQTSRGEWPVRKTQRADQKTRMEKLKDSSEKEQPSKHGLKEEMDFTSVLFIVFGFPRLVINSAVRRFTLMVWWTGVWVNQGISIFRVENSWTRLESAKTRLEQDKLSLEEHLLHLQHIIYRKDEELSREKGLRIRLLAKLAQDKKRQCEHEATIGELSRSVVVLNSCVKNLNRELRALKTTFVKKHENSEEFQEEPSLQSSPEPAVRTRIRQGGHTQCTCFELDEFDADGTENHNQCGIQSRNPRAPNQNDTVRQRLGANEDEQDNKEYAGCQIKAERCSETRRRRPRERTTRCPCFKVFFVSCLMVMSVAVLLFYVCPVCFQHCWAFFGNHLNNEIPLTSRFLTWVTGFLEYMFLMNSS